MLTGEDQRTADRCMLLIFTIRARLSRDLMPAPQPWLMAAAKLSDPSMNFGLERPRTTQWPPLVQLLG